MIQARFTRTANLLHFTRVDIEDKLIGRTGLDVWRGPDPALNYMVDNSSALRAVGSAEEQAVLPADRYEMWQGIYSTSFLKKLGTFWPYPVLPLNGLENICAPEG